MVSIGVENFELDFIIAQSYINLAGWRVGGRMDVKAGLRIA